VKTETDLGGAEVDEDPWIAERGIALLVGGTAWLLLSFNPYFFDGPVAKGTAIWASATLTLSVVFSAIFAKRESNVGKSPLVNLWFTLTQALTCSLPLSVIIFANVAGLPPVPSTLYALSVGLIVAMSLGIGIRFFRVAAMRMITLIACQVCLATLIVVFAALWTNWQGDRAFASLEETTPVSPLSGQCSSTPNVLFTHISDLHLANPGSQTTYDGSEPGNRYVPDLLAAIARVHPAYLLISGDITDRGFIEQWRSALRYLAPLASNTPIILAPGNHDLSNAFEGDLSDVTPETRLQRFVTAQEQLFSRLLTAKDATLGDVVKHAPTFDDPDYVAAEGRLQECRQTCEALLPRLPIAPKATDPGERPMLELRETQRRQGECAATCAARLSSDNAFIEQHIAAYHDYWNQVREQAFPLYWLDEAKGLAVFSLMLEPSAGANGLGNNAIGYLDKNQAQRLKSKIAALPPSIESIAVMMHHPPTRAPDDAMRVPPFTFAKLGRFVDDLYNSQWWSYAFLRADPNGLNELVGWLRDFAEGDRNRSLVIVFGHRHQRSLGRVGRVIAMEAPNVASSRERGFYLTTRSAAGALAVSWCGSP